MIYVTKDKYVNLKFKNSENIIKLIEKFKF